MRVEALGQAITQGSIPNKSRSQNLKRREQFEKTEVLAASQQQLLITNTKRYRLVYFLTLVRQNIRLKYEPFLR